MDAEAPMEYMTTEEYEARNKAMEGLMMLRQHWPALAQLQTQDPPRNHVCRTCHMAFTRLDNLQRHIRRLHEADADTLYYRYFIYVVLQNYYKILLLNIKLIDIY